MQSVRRFEENNERLGLLERALREADRYEAFFADYDRWLDEQDRAFAEDAERLANETAARARTMGETGETELAA
jgi:hypothetical protein